MLNEQSPYLPTPEHRTTTHLVGEREGILLTPATWRFRCLCGLLADYPTYHDADQASLAHLRANRTRTDAAGLATRKDEG